MVIEAESGQQELPDALFLARTVEYKAPLKTVVKVRGCEVTAVHVWNATL